MERLTKCCQAMSTYMDGVLCCKACFKAVPVGEGDGSGYSPTSADKPAAALAEKSADKPAKAPEGVFSVKGVKTFIGNEGHGFNATLFFHGKKVAFVLDDASGGETDYQWVKGAEEQVMAFIKAHVPVPAWMADFRDNTDANGSARLDDVMNGLVEEFLQERRFKSLCKTKTVFETEESRANGQYITLKTPWGPAAKAWIEKKYPGQKVTVFNEKYGPPMVAPAAKAPEQHGVRDAAWWQRKIAEAKAQIAEAEAQIAKSKKLS